jgi:hypothetical protein
VVSQIWPALPDDQLLFRAHRNESSRNSKTGKPKPKTFFRRATEFGLSVYFSRESALLSGLDIAGLCCFRKADLLSSPHPLALIQDASDHAQILGVPLKSEDEQKMLDIADHLVRLSEDVPL